MGAQAGEKEQNQVQEETAGVPSLQILLKPIMAPITGASQYYAPITLFIEAVNKRPYSENLPIQAPYR